MLGRYIVYFRIRIGWVTIVIVNQVNFFSVISKLYFLLLCEKSDVLSRFVSELVELWFYSYLFYEKWSCYFGLHWLNSGRRENLKRCIYNRYFNRVFLKAMVFVFWKIIDLIDYLQIRPNWGSRNKIQCFSLTIEFWDV